MQIYITLGDIRQSDQWNDGPLSAVTERLENNFVQITHMV